MNNTRLDNFINMDEIFIEFLESINVFNSDIRFLMNCREVSPEVFGTYLIAGI